MAGFELALESTPLYHPRIYGNLLIEIGGNIGGMSMKMIIIAVICCMVEAGCGGGAKLYT